MSNDTSSSRPQTNRDEFARRKLEEHETVHEQFDRRISINENWRLQAIGALKVLALILGAGGLAAIGEVLIGGLI